MLNDLRFALRMFRKNPGFTGVAVLTLALGIGGTTAIFSVIYGALLNPWPYTDSDRLAVLITRDLKNRWHWAYFSQAEFLDYQEQSRVFDQVFGGLEESVLLTGRDAPLSWSGQRTTPNTFQVLGIQPVIGRNMTDDDARPGAPPVVVLNYTVWQQTFGGDPGIVGQTLTLNHRPTTVIGVMPPRFKFFTGTGGPDCWLPTLFSRGESSDNSQKSAVFGHLKPGVTFEQASAEMEVLAKRLAAVYPSSYPPGFTFSFVSLTEAGDYFEPTRTTLSLLMGAVGLLLLIACVNVANLLLAHATRREREFAIRSSLGAGHFHLIRQLMIESVLLALTGGFLGTLLVLFALPGMVAIIPPFLIPDEAVIRINGWVLLFTLGVSLASTLFFGLTPALVAVRGDLQAPLKAGGRGFGESSRHHRLRSRLVVSEIALSLVLLSGAGLMMHSFITLQQVKLGYNPEHTYTVAAGFYGEQYNTPEKHIQIQLEFLRSMRAVPGVMSATLNSPAFTWLGSLTAVQIDGEHLGEEQRVNFSRVGDRFFETVGTPILLGRGISEEDLAGRRKVAVVNQAFVRRYFGTKNPLGRQVKVVAWETEEYPKQYQVKDPWFEIVGVSADTAVTDWTSFHKVARSKPMVYVCYTVTSGVQVTLRTAGRSAGGEQSIRRAVAGLNKEAPLGIKSLDQERQLVWFGVPRLLTTVFLTFACLGLILVSVGVFGVLSYAVSQRTHEIGVRMALGAQAIDVRRMVMITGLRWLAIGIGIGVSASIALVRILRNLIWGIESADPLTLVVVSLLLTAVGLAACYFPARRATKVDPMVALRYE
jgi:putative ABC transport system permease protein